MAKSYDLFHKTVRQQLQGYGVRLNENASPIERERPPLLTILSQGFSETPLSYGNSGQIQHIHLTFQASYEITDAKGNTLIPVTPLLAERELAISPQNPLATDQEKERLQERLRQEAAAQLIRQLSLQTQHPYQADAERS